MANQLFLNFSGGINRKVAPLLAEDSEAELIINYDLDKIGALTKRSGIEQNGDQPVAGKDVRGLFYDTESSDHVMVVNNSGDTNSVIYSKSPNSSTFSAQKSDDQVLGTTARGFVERTRFVNFVGRIFRVVGGKAAMLSAASATLSFSDAECLENESPHFIAVFQDRLYAARDNSPGKESRVWYSSLPDASFNLTWDDTANGQWFDVNPDDGDYITGLENNGNRLLIFKQRALYRWVFGATEPDRLIGVGAVNQEVIQTNFDVGITFFANPFGVYAYSGNRPRNVSRKIQDIINAVTADGWAQAVAGIDNEHYYLSVGDVTIDGRDYSNVVLVYNISLDAWVVYTFSVKPTYFANLPITVTEGAPRFPHFGANDGKVYRMNVGSNDNSNPIATYFRSKEYMIRYPETVNVNAVYFFAQERGNTQVRFDLDRSWRTQSLGQIVGRTTKLDLPAPRECNSFRLYCTDNSIGPSVIEGFNLEFEQANKTDDKGARIRRYGGL